MLRERKKANARHFHRWVRTESITGIATVQANQVQSFQVEVFRYLFKHLDELYIYIYTHEQHIP